MRGSRENLLPYKDREARKAWRRRWQAANPEKTREYKRRWKAAHAETHRDRVREYSATKAHGISRVVRDWMYESQNRACAGCLTPTENTNLQIDHDHNCCPGLHSCGRCVRGLVCQGCNNRDVLAAAFAERFGVST